MSIQSNFPNLKPSLLLDFANTKTLDPRITFTRGTSATYYDGKTTVMAEQNLFLSSQDFQTANGWAMQDGAQTLTLNSTAAPDGTTTADTLIEPPSGSSTPRWYQIKTVTPNTAYTISCYLKANTRTFAYVQLEILGVGNVIQYFNLSTGAASTLTTTGSSSNVSNTITSAGNGWYRCTLTATFPSGTSMYAFIGLANSTPTQYYSCNGSSIYAWGAQFEARSTATTYTPTTSQPIKNYVPQLLTAGTNQARFDHNPVTGESLGLLVEEQRTNVASYSADLGNSSAWPQAGITVISNANVAPDGSLTAIRMIAATSSGDHDLYRYFNLDNSSYTLSVYAKYSGAHLALSASGPSSPWAGCIFDLQNGVAKTPQGTGITCTASIQSVGNGWYRCSITFTATSSYGWYAIISSTNNVNATMGAYGFIAYPGDGWNGVQLWGAQLEAGAFATSYIPTTSASVTRTLDRAQITGTNFSSWYNQAEGTLYAEASPQTASSGSYALACLTSTGVSNSISMYYTGGTAVDIETLVNGSVQYTFLVTRGAPPSKVAHGYKVNDSNIALNGTAPTTDTVCLIPEVNKLLIGTIYDENSYPCNGTIRKIAYYPVRVTNAQLQALTA